MNIPASFKKDGFEVVEPDYPKRLLLATDGLERTGKTDFALDTPGPIIYIGLDMGHEGVIEKHAKKRVIAKKYHYVPPVSNQTAYLEIWKRVLADIQKAAANRDARTTILDTGTDIWELLRLAEFGQLSPAADIKRAYQPLNQMYKSIIRAFYGTSQNLIVIHKCSKEYKDEKVSTNKGVQVVSKWTGEYERAGFKESGYLIQANIRHMYDQANRQFGIKVIDCRQNMDIAGLELWGDDARFSVLAQYVFPDSTEDDWK
jgi:hypothetical protein